MKVKRLLLFYIFISEQFYLVDEITLGEYLSIEGDLFSVKAKLFKKARDNKWDQVIKDLRLLSAENDVIIETG